VSSKVVFEVGAIASAVARAARVAPSKGMAFDKAAGVLIEGDPDSKYQITVRATDIEVGYLERLTPNEIETDEKFFWRIPSGVFAGLLSSLPPSSTVEMTEHKGTLYIVCGKVKAKLQTIRGEGDSLGALYWEPFDGEDLSEIAGLATKITQVSWACDKQTVPFSGVHMNGTHLIATDKYKLVRVPCPLALEHSITAPLDAVSPILAKFDDVRLGVEGGLLQIEIDEYTQITSTVFGNEYPNVERAMRTDYPHSFQVDKALLAEAVGRMLALMGRTERYPVVNLTIKPDDAALDLRLEVPVLGEMQDELEITGASGPETTLSFSPDYITNCLQHVGSSVVTIAYDPDKTTSAVLFTDGLGFEAWIMPRRPGGGS